MIWLSFLIVFFSFIPNLSAQQTELPLTEGRTEGGVGELSDPGSTIDTKISDNLDDRGRIWSISLESVSEIGIGTLNRRSYLNDSPEDDASTENTLMADFRIMGGFSLGVGQVWTSTWGLGNNLSESKADDTFLQATQKDIFSSSQIVDTEGLLRVYLPTGEDSRRLEQFARVRGELLISRKISGNVGLGYVFRPEYYFQRYQAYYDTKEETVVGTKQAELWNYLELEWSLTKDLTFTQIVGVIDRWNHSDANYSVPEFHGQDFLAETSLGYQMIEEFELVAGIYQEGPDLRAQQRDFSPYREDETSYFVQGQLNF